VQLPPPPLLHTFTYSASIESIPALRAIAILLALPALSWPYAVLPMFLLTADRNVRFYLVDRATRFRPLCSSGLVPIYGTLPRVEAVL